MITQKTNSYHRKEKLKSRKLIDEVFTKGKSISVFPIRAFYICSVQAAMDNPVKASAGTSTRNFKKAVQRNRVKRLLREAYRKNKEILYSACEEKKNQLAVFFLFTGKEIPPYSLIESKMKILLDKLSNEMVTQNT